MIIGLLFTVTKYAGPLLLIAALVYEYKLQYLSSDTNREHHRKASLARVFIVGIAGVLSIIVSARDDYTTARQAEEDRLFRGQQESREKEIGARLYQIESQQSNNKATYDTILANLATNYTPNPTILSSLSAARAQSLSIDSDILDLSAWQSNLNTRSSVAALQKEAFRLKAAEEQRTFIAPYLPKWDHALDKLAGSLSKLAIQKHVTLSGKYTGLPSLETICTGYTDADRYSERHIPVATLSLGSNGYFSAQAYIRTFTDMVLCSINRENRPSLIIEVRALGTASTLRIYDDIGIVQIGSQTRTDTIPPTGFEPTIDALTEDTIAAHAGALNSIHDTQSQ